MKTVVLVDDNPMILQAFRHSIPLDSLGYQVIGYFTNSSEALAFCSTHRPQMLITDIKMPGMSGLELIERLQAVYSNFLPSSLPVMMSLPSHKGVAPRRGRHYPEADR